MIRPLSYADTDVFLVCFAISDRTSMEHVKTLWYEEIEEDQPGTYYHKQTRKEMCKLTIHCL